VAEPAGRGALATWGPVLVMAALLAFAFQGTRGIWEPDEGFYSNVALGMLESGDWLVPRLNGDPFIEKPPLHFWGMALGMRVLGVNEWGARSANALWFVGAILLVGAIGARLWGRRTGRLAAIVYATTLLPFLASNVLTPDTLLAFWTVAAAYGYLRAAGSGDDEPARGWWLLVGAAGGLGILSKGPAMLIFLSPLAAHLAGRRGPGRALRTPGVYLAAAIAVVLGGWWYLLTIARLPGAADFMLDNQVIGRLFTSTYRRNPGLLGGLKVYLPVLTLGMLPWSALWPFLVKRLRPLAGGTLSWRRLRERPVALLVVLWIAIPLAVLLLAQSRLPLYALPLAAPAALATARLLESARASGPARFGWRTSAALLAGWCLCLVAAKGYVSERPSSRDARDMAAQIDARVGTRNLEVIAIDDKRNGLPFYGFTNFEWVTVRADRYPYFTRTETLAEEIRENAALRIPHLYLVPHKKVHRVERMLAAGGFTCGKKGKAQGFDFLLCDPKAPAPEEAPPPPGASKPS